MPSEFATESVYCYPVVSGAWGRVPVKSFDTIDSGDRSLRSLSFFLGWIFGVGHRAELVRLFDHYG